MFVLWWDPIQFGVGCGQSERFSGESKTRTITQERRTDQSQLTGRWKMKSFQRNVNNHRQSFNSAATRLDDDNYFYSLYSLWQAIQQEPSHAHHQIRIQEPSFFTRKPPFLYILHSTYQKDTQNGRPIVKTNQTPSRGSSFCCCRVCDVSVMFLSQSCIRARCRDSVCVGITTENERRFWR